MQQNGIKRDDGRGRVSRVSETGIKIEGRENWLSFSKPEYRKEPFEVPIVGDFVEYRYAKKGTGTCIQSINVLGREEHLSRMGSRLTTASVGTSPHGRMTGSRG